MTHASLDHQLLLNLDNTASTVLSVSELTGQLRATVEDGVGDVCVEGEVSNFTRAASGHCYFSLKDVEAQLRCVMWRGTADRLSFRPRDGLRVRAQGQTSVYERRGDLQLKVQELQPAGEGALQQAFEALKRKLADEGLFDAEHKQSLPSFPATIGLVTSGDGAALHDILSTLERRFPRVQVLLCPVKVQGPSAAGDIADAIRRLNAHDEPLDVLIVGRGGGSAEDLWAFNEEAVARAVFASHIPVVSAVGHETDIVIADLVADQRAATPSIAAELVVPDRIDLAEQVRALHTALNDRLNTRLDEGRQRLDHLTRAYGFKRPADRLRQARRRLENLTQRLHRSTPRRVATARDRLTALCQRLTLLDPRRPLERGYVKVERGGQSIAKAALLDAGDAVTLCFNDGARSARIED